MPQFVSNNEGGRKSLVPVQGAAPGRIAYASDGSVSRGSADISSGVEINVLKLLLFVAEGGAK
jgi:hypothetical protein